MKSHQRVIREQHAVEIDEHIEDKILAASSFEHANVEPISGADAKVVILKYEWLGNMGSTRQSYGLYFTSPKTNSKYLAGVACFGVTGGVNVDKSICGEEYANRVATLTRGACVHWAHPHSASYLINKSCKLMAYDKQINIFIAYSDEEAGEIGTVYQASNWLYIGKGSRGKRIIRNDRIYDVKLIGNMVYDYALKPTKNANTTQEELDAWAKDMIDKGYKVNGKKKPYAFTKTRADVTRQLIEEGCVWIKGNPKGRYIHIEGDKNTVRKLRKALRYKPLPYPKRCGVTEEKAIDALNRSLVRCQNSAPSLNKQAMSTAK